MNKKDAVNAMILASDKDTRNYYHQAIRTSGFIDRIDLAQDLDELKQLCEQNAYRYFFVGKINNLKKALPECRCQVLENMPSTRIILIGMQWSDSDASSIIYPIRGVIDLRFQTHPEMHKSLDLIHKNGFDFSLVIDHHPHMRDMIKQHAAKMPINDNRFLEFLPLLGSTCTMAQNASYLGISERTLRNLREKWRVEMNVSNHREMYAVALQLGWTTTQASHAAIERMQRFLFEKGSYD